MIYALRIIQITFLAFLFPGFLLGQDQNIEELKKRLSKTQNSDTRLDVLFKIGNHFLLEYPDSAFHYASKILSEHHQNNNIAWQARGNLLMARAYNETKDYQKALTSSQEALQAFSSLNDNKGTADCFYEKGYAFNRLALNDSCSYYLDLAWPIFEKLDNKLQLANIKRVRGLSYWGTGNYTKALINIDDAIFRYKVLNDSINLSRSLNTKGAINWGLSNYELSLESFFEALNIADKRKNNVNQLIILYNNIGLVYHDWQYSDKAYSYYKKAEGLIELSTNPLGITYTYLNLGTHFLNQGDIDVAIELLVKAQNGYDQLGDINGVCLAKIRIAQCYTFDKNYEKAKNTFFEAVEDAQKSKNKHRIALAYYHLSNSEFKREEMASAKDYALESLKLATEGNYKDVLYLVYERLSVINENSGNYNDALIMLKEAAELKEEIFKKKINVQYEVMELTHENEQKEFENAQLKSQNILKEKIIQYQTYVVVVVILLFAAILILYYRLSRKKKDLQLANQAKDKIFSIVSHDLRAPVGNLNNMIDFMVNDDSQEDYKKMLNMFKPVITNSYNLLDNLLVWAKTNLGKLDFKGERMNVQPMVEETILPFINIAQKKNITIDYLSHRAIYVYTDKILFQTILRNLINNAIKFTNELGMIQVKVERKQKNAIISVIDNGVGISKSKLDSMFDGNKHTLGTNNETGSGIGLLLCHELANKNGGKLWVNSVEGKGSTFCFSIPTPTKK